MFSLIRDMSKQKMNECRYLWDLHVLHPNTDLSSEVFPKPYKNFQWQLVVKPAEGRSFIVYLTPHTFPDDSMEIYYAVTLRDKEYSLLQLKGSYIHENGVPRPHEIMKFQPRQIRSEGYLMSLEIVICASSVCGQAPSKLYEKWELNVISQDSQTNVLNSVLMDPEFSDLKLEVGGITFNVHKCVLGLVSTVFRATLTNEMTEKSSGFIKINDFEADVFEKLIDFIYKGSAEITDFRMGLELLRAADIYDISTLKECCIGYLLIQVNQDNVIEILRVADIANADSLKAYAIEYFCDNHKAYNPNDFIELSKIRPDLPLILLSKLTKKHATLNNSS